ncbi:hypothetical protein [Paludisphaera mucosa]|uniref:Uncharacterized protein n=1 Tax=Paludisphaera mucosa TaxID=3030827 RepID=A0ABT6F497_9BACT|nr:hypothetical protein [Paludisphaera mucosa]MDG3002263.1 hypothetical protein [Paludisphaera mucosa]
MTPTDADAEPDDRLARAEAALRDATVPEGPSADLVARTRAALRAADARSAPDPQFRRRTMFTMFKFAAAALAALATAGLTYLAAPPRAAATTAFQEAAKKLREARTLSYRGSFRAPGQDAPTIMILYYKDPGRTRTEIGEPPTVASIVDASRGEILILDLAQKTATRQDWKPDDAQKPRLERQASDFAEQLRSLAGKDARSVGRRRIGEVEAQGFRVEDEGLEWTAWIDPAKKLPLLMESTVMGMTFVMSDFRIDPPLDDALFRMDPPDGFAARKIDALPPAGGEQSLIDLLRLYAEAGEGDFPPRLDDVTAVTTAFQKRFPKEQWKGADDPRMIRTVQSLAAAVVFVQLNLKRAFGYAPDGAKLGDAGRVLFWYRPKDAESYRAIFADLHVEDVAEDRLPEKPKF